MANVSIHFGPHSIGCLKDGILKLHSKTTRPWWIFWAKPKHEIFIGWNTSESYMDRTFQFDTKEEMLSAVRDIQDQIRLYNDQI